MSRRNFLKLVGGGLVLAAVGGGVWSATRDPARARLPWQTAGEDRSDPRLHALSYALLAPNPHNRQPWLADLGRPDEIVLYCDLDRRLPDTDPFDRQITIGLGAFVELLSMAAAENNRRSEIELFPEGEPQPRLDERPVARIRFVADTSGARDPLFPHVPARRSNKEAYDMARSVPADALSAIAGAARQRVGYSNDGGRVGELRQLAWDAMQTEFATPRALKESIDLLRIGRAEIEARPDGISLPGPLLEGLWRSGLLSREAMLDPDSFVFREQVAAMKSQFDTAMAFLWLVTPGNSRADQIAAGRDYVRLNLAATAKGIAMQPFSQALQEYPEMRPHHLSLRDRLGIDDNETLQMFVRLGYGPQIEAAPRWPLDNRIRSA